MNTIGYRTVNVKDISELNHSAKDKDTIELLEGNVGTGKTTLLSKYFKTANKCIYISNHLDNEYYGRINLIKINKHTDIDLEKTINSKFKEFNKVYIYLEECRSKQETLKALFKYCSINGVELLVDVDNYMINIEELLIDLNSKIHLTLSTFNANKIIKKVKSETDMYEFVRTEVDFRVTLKLNEVNNHSGDVSLRMPKTLHYELKKEAEREGISLNQYLIYLLASRKI